MLYIHVPEGSPAFHLAFEQTVFENVDDDVLLLWVNSPTVCCGAYQNVYREVNLFSAKKYGVEVLRRISGGGTVFHDKGNLNYSIIKKCDGYEGYDAVLSTVTDTLNLIGVPAKKKNNSDIYLNGKKISGNAQRIVGNKILHHGTLLFSADISLMRLLFDRKNKTYIDKAVNSNKSSVTNINTVYTAGDINDFKNDFISHFVIPLTEREPSRDLVEKAKQLEKEKYCEWEWNFGRSPDFTCSATDKIKNIEITANYSVQKGIVKTFDLQINGVHSDFSSEFIGIDLTMENVYSICAKHFPLADELTKIIL